MEGCATFGGRGRGRLQPKEKAPVRVRVGDWVRVEALVRVRGPARGWTRGGGGRERAPAGAEEAQLRSWGACE